MSNTPISAYCLVAIAEHDYGLDRSMFDVLRVVSSSLLDTMPIRELFGNLEPEKTICDDGQLQIDFDLFLKSDNCMSEKSSNFALAIRNT